MIADRDAGPMKAHHIEATRGDRHLHRCRAAGIEPALGMAMDLGPLNRGVLLLIGETTTGSAGWSGGGMALDVRSPECVTTGTRCHLRRYGRSCLWGLR